MFLQEFYLKKEIFDSPVVFTIKSESSKAFLIKSFLYPVSLEKAVQFNRQLRMPSKKPQERKRFLAYYFKTRSFKKAIKMCSPKFYYKQRIKKILIKFHILSNK